MKKSIIPCETAIDYFFPALKASIARELLSEYSFNQTDVASKLGVTQAAVSKYLGGHYSAGIKNFEKNPQIRNAAKKMGFLIAKEKIKREEIGKLFCKYCKEVLNSEC